MQLTAETVANLNINRIRQAASTLHIAGYLHTHCCPQTEITIGNIDRLAYSDGVGVELVSCIHPLLPFFQIDKGRAACNNIFREIETAKMICEEYIKQSRVQYS